MKDIWRYIKTHDLQDPSDGRKIVCNRALSVVFGTRHASFSDVAGLLSKHLFKSNATMPLHPKTSNDVTEFASARYGCVRRSVGAGAVDPAVSRLDRAKRMLNKKLITQADYDTIKIAALNRLGSKIPEPQTSRRAIRIASNSARRQHSILNSGNAVTATSSTSRSAVPNQNICDESETLYEVSHKIAGILGLSRMNHLAGELSHKISRKESLKRLGKYIKRKGLGGRHENPKVAVKIRCDSILEELFGVKSFTVPYAWEMLSIYLKPIPENTQSMSTTASAMQTTSRANPRHETTSATSLTSRTSINNEIDTEQQYQNPSNKYWVCSSCTYHNENMLANICEICCTTRNAINGMKENNQSDESEKDSSLSEKETNISEKETPKCVVCWDAEQDAVIIHGDTAHQACCMKCAKQLKKLKKRCPICRKRISKVVKNFRVN